ncbi:Pantothenate transporter [Wickerhamomyces ciferrii]|uniref:Pantothenate transporter n=1 Tax=Wickerhamomyces ciferrii (strain ATCC 14091 / BCRC 22168 / CBS 111 / JCM 3599 / NBRC 0793 / NRRL Y-1031 F-60-10) TaxID=1206466 RepID=K0K799_WICCF|nr:Pantothenate transporter [Wickerhamomyces ciferrii]CCH40715.1 Pantothenate transporter [Wickerhamomyces ciferrii]
MTLVVLKSLRTLVWGPPPETKLERNLLFKIDWFVLSYTCLAFWCLAIDTSNVSNAYVSGMKEELGIKGNQFNIINTCWTVGYVVGMIPNNLILLKIKPSIWMNFCMFIWGIFTLGMFKVNNWKQICALRFFQAAFESVIFSGSHMILGAWYKPNELSKRSAIFTSSALIGGIFSGSMQGRIQSTMHGLKGLSGWRWLFIIDFLITFVVVIYGILCFPDTPELCHRKFIFSDEEIQLARSRVIKPPPIRLDRTVFLRVLKNWKWYGFSLLFTLAGENISWNANSIFALWLTYNKYPIQDRNYYPMGISAVGIISSFISGIYIDMTHKFLHIALIVSTVLLISTILIWSAPLNTTAVFIAHYLTGISYSVQPVFFAWCNLSIQNDAELKIVTLASMNMFSNAVNAWWGLLFFAADQVPLSKRGCYAMLATIITTPLVALGINYGLTREKRRKEQISHEELESQTSVVEIEHNGIDKQ